MHQTLFFFWCAYCFVMLFRILRVLGGIVFRFCFWLSGWLLYYFLQYNSFQLPLKDCCGPKSSLCPLVHGFWFVRLFCFVLVGNWFMDGGVRQHDMYWGRGHLLRLWSRFVKLMVLSSMQMSMVLVVGVLCWKYVDTMKMLSSCTVGHVGECCYP